MAAFCHVQTVYTRVAVPVLLSVARLHCLVYCACHIIIVQHVFNRWHIVVHHVYYTSINWNIAQIQTRRQEVSNIVTMTPWWRGVSGCRMSELLSSQKHTRAILNKITIRLSTFIHVLSAVIAVKLGNCMSLRQSNKHFFLTGFRQHNPHQQP